MGFSTKENEKEVICTHAMDGLQIQERKVPNSTIFSWFVIILVIPVYWNGTPQVVAHGHIHRHVLRLMLSQISHICMYIYMPR